MFDAAYKKPIPRYATRIGIVTGAYGSRHTGYPQHCGQKESLCAVDLISRRSCRGRRQQQALCAASMRWMVLVWTSIIVGRGGGSIEESVGIQ